MADEITIVSYLADTSGGSTVVSDPSTVTLREDQTGTKKTHNQQTVGTSWELVSLGDILSDSGTVGWVRLKNLDATNSVEVAVDNAGSYKCGKMQPGMPWGPCELSNVTSGQIWVKANTAACQVMVTACQL